MMMITRRWKRALLRAAWSRAGSSPSPTKRPVLAWPAVMVEQVLMMVVEQKEEEVAK